MISGAARKAALAALLLCGPAFATDADTAKAIAGVLGYDQISARMVAYCEAQAPAQAAPVRSAWQRWRAQNQIDAIEQAAGTASVQAARKATQAQADSIAASLARKGPAASVCAQMPATWSEASMDVRRQFPLAYPSAAPVAPTAVAAATDRPTGTVFTPSQLDALADQWRASGRAGQPAGPFYIRGTLVRRGDHVFLEQEEDGFKARLFVSPDIDLRAHVGRQAVLEGYLDKPPAYPPVKLRRTRLVLDPSGLKPSPLPQAGLYRAEVPVERVRAEPGRGVPPAELSAVLLESRTNGSGGMVDKVYYLLKDGTAYLRGELPPADLDVARSRQLEPQQWARWRKTFGGSYEIQRQDDFGKPAGPWQKLNGTPARPWPSGSRPDGVYAVSSFNGSIALGGVYARSSVTLHRDGRFTSSRFAQGGSGSMAGAGGFTGSMTRSSDSTGSRSSAGGGNAAVTATSRAARDDGAEHRGSYVLDGYTAELRYDSGRVERGLSFPRDDGQRMIYWFHSVYLRQ